MFFKKPEKARIIAYDSYPASVVDFEKSSSESYTNNLPNHTVLSRNTWEYEKNGRCTFSYRRRLGMD